MKEYIYPIDYSLFNIEEIAKIVQFLNAVESFNNGENRINLMKLHNEYKNILNSKQIERDIERDFKKITNISIYEIMKRVKNDN